MSVSPDPIDTKFGPHVHELGPPAAVAPSGHALHEKSVPVVEGAE